VNECFSSGSVEGQYAVGGVCGVNAGSIRNSFSSVNVVGQSSVGGFCGSNYSPLGFFANCYSTGSVVANAYFGGFCGSSSDETAAVTNCFWDIQLSLCAESSGGIGLTTEEMQMQSSFADAGWDFSAIWGMSGYPVLRTFKHLLSVANGAGQGVYSLGDEISIVADPPPSGYEFLRWNVFPADYTNNLFSADSSVTTFVMPYGNIILSAEYRILEYEVTFDLGDHGTHTGGGALMQSVTHGDDAVVPVFDVDPGWTFTGWSGAFSNVTENINVSASFITILTSLEITGPSNVNETSNGVYGCTAYYADGSSQDITDNAIWSVGPDVPGVELDNNEITVRSITNNSQVTISVEYNENGVTKTAQQLVDILNLPYSGGAGSEANPYIIATKADLLQVAATATDYDKHFMQIDDIDLAGESLSNAVIASSKSTFFYSGTKFTGVFDGGGHIIKNLLIDSPVVGNDYLALFGYLDAGAVVCNLSVVDSVITGAASGSANIGGICGYNKDSVISNCYASVTASGDDYIGGICGRSDGGTFECNYSAGLVSGDNYIGGLCGRDIDGLFNNCYASAAVSGDDYVGGLTAYFYRSAVNSCYSSGYVIGDRYSGGFAGYVSSTIVNNSFWDTQTSGYATSAAGTGRTTAEMQTESTFTDAGWDFTDIWYMDGYPALRCLNTPGTYDYWLMNNPAITVGLRAETDTPSDDGIPNLLKYACGLPAMDPCTTADLMTIEPCSSNSFSVFYYKSKSAHDVTLQPIWAETLPGPWNALGIATEMVGEDAEREQWKASVPLSDSGFIKLRATAE